MKWIARLYLIILKTEKYYDLMHYVYSCIGGIPLFHHEGTNAYTTRQVKYRYVLHNAAVTVTNSNGRLA